MNTKPIRDEAELASVLKRLEEIWGAPLDSPEGDELETLAIQVEKFEAEHYPLPALNTTEAIEFRMDQKN